MAKKRKWLHIVFIVLAVLSTVLSVYCLCGYSHFHNSVSTVSGSIPMSVGSPLAEAIAISLAILSLAGTVVFSLLARKFSKSPSAESNKTPEVEKP